MAKNVYLDYAAATPLSEAVRMAMEPYLSDIFYNPSANYSLGRQAKEALNGARKTIAATLGAKPSEITFTAGGSEANNLAVHGVMNQFPGKIVITSAIEHDSVLAPAKKHNFVECPVRPDGLIDLKALEKLIDDDTVLVSIMYVNNEIGTVQPLSSIAKLIEKVRKERKVKNINLPIYFHSDGCQAANYLVLQASRLGVDLMTINGGKIYGPKQSGLLFVKSNVKISSLIDGGGQEHNLRSGTENVPAVMGLAKALDDVQSIRKEEASRLEELRDYFMKELVGLRPDCVINGSRKHRVANNVHVTFPGIDNETLLIKLDQEDIMAAAGSACSASTDESSHVLHAIGLNDDQARSSIRFSLGQSTTKADIDSVIETLKRIL